MYQTRTKAWRGIVEDTRIPGCFWGIDEEWASPKRTTDLVDADEIQ